MNPVVLTTPNEYRPHILGGFKRIQSLDGLWPGKGVGWFAPYAKLKGF